MTNIADLILDLQHASGPVRRLDFTIARLLGYKRVSNPKNGKDVSYWIDPITQGKRHLPHFTARIDAARICAELLIPKCRGGYTWNSNYATSRINNGPIVSGATPALAICVAAFSTSQMTDK